jgi:uncharacterized Fe-S center protein
MSVVHFLPVTVKRMDEKHSLLARYERLLAKLITPRMVGRKKVAVKMHLGGRHGYTQIHPAFVTRVVSRVKECGGSPFVTDNRGENPWAGEVPAAFGCPIHSGTGVADGYFYRVKTGWRELPEVEVAGFVHDADVLINLSHAKGHGQCGFGAGIKNLGMGPVTDRTRGDIHRLMDRAFRWHASKCTRCGKCVSHCEHKAIWFSEQDELRQDSHFCTLCLHCMMVCPKGAITVGREGWPKFQKGLAVTAKAVLGSFERTRVLHINVALNVTAICDCFGFSIPPFRPDIGVLASTDLVAADKAALDLIDCGDVLPGALPEGVKLREGEGHILQRIWNKDPFLQIREAAKLRLGSMRYTLKTIT